MWVPPSHHPFIDGIFPIKNQPFLGTPMTSWNPPDPNRHQWMLIPTEFHLRSPRNLPLDC